MLKAIALASVLVALCLTALSSQAQDFDPSLPGQQQILEGSEPMPEIIEIWEDRQYPWFVAVEKVFLPSGDFDDSYASRDVLAGEPSVLSALKKRRTPDDCADLTVLSSLDEESALGSSLRAALENSESVIIGRVTGQRVGIQDTFLGSAFRIEMLEVRKGPGPRFPSSYCFLRGGEARVWGERVCSDNPLAGDLPRVGEKVLVLLGSGINNREKKGLLVSPANIIPIRKGAIRLGFPYSREENLSGLDGEDLLALIEQLLGEGGN